MISIYTKRHYLRQALYSEHNDEMEHDSVRKRGQSTSSEILAYVAKVRGFVNGHTGHFSASVFYLPSAILSLGAGCKFPQLQSSY